MKAKLMTMAAAMLICCLSGCGASSPLRQYDMDGIEYLEYTDIDSVCDTPELTQAGFNFLSSMEEQLLLSFVMDSSIELSEELGDYDHLILTNPQWVERFGDPEKLKPVGYESLSDSMRKFLDAQMPVMAADESVWPDGMGLYHYEGGRLLAFPVNVTLGAAEPVEAEHPLVILVEQPVQALSAGRCLLPLTSSGNVLFTDGERLKTALEGSALRDYAAVQALQDHAG